MWPHREGQGVGSRNGSFIHSITSCVQDTLLDSILEQLYRQLATESRALNLGHCVKLVDGNLGILCIIFFSETE